MMTTKQTLIPVSALVLALSVGVFTAEAGQQDREGRDRNGRSSQRAPSREGSSGGSAVERRDGSQERGGRSSAAPAPERQSAERQYDGRRDERARPAPAPVPPPNAYRDNRGRDDRYRYDNRRYDDRRYDGYRAYAPRVYRPAPRRYYGPGGNLSVYFGWGSGYLYGSAWSGRVYGYRAPYAYGARVYYGDVRLLVQPRDAAVYVDGYYAGIVDNFDGVFQRLTLEVGPHTIELVGPGEPQVFDVYVDPARTTTIRTDLFR
ncbi:MAG: hypothetical protein QM736_09670 [Vicinamibacterales bacterium]